MRILVSLGLLGLCQIALAVPLQLTHQGRFLDGTGVPVTGNQDVTLTIYNAPVNGQTLWSETQNLPFEDGYYVFELGNDIANNPLDDSIFDDDGLYLGIEVDGVTVNERPPLHSVPYALRARVAHELATGTIIDAAEIRVDGDTVIDSDGAFVGNLTGQTLGSMTCASGQIAVYDGASWVCAAASSGGSSAWADLVGVPSGFADDVDDDTLGTLLCGEGDVPQYSVTFAAWGCVPLAVDWADVVGVPSGLLDGIDDVLTEAEVETFVTNGGLDLNGATTIGGAGIVTSWTNLPAIPAGFADGVDDMLDESAVETFIVNGPLDFAAGSQLDGLDIATTDLLPTGADFATSDQACGVGDVVTGIDSAGDVVCGASDGPINVSGTATCDASAVGTLRFDTTDEDLLLCDGTDWVLIKATGELFSFTTHTFTTCGSSGQDGPALASCRAQYGTSWDEDNAWFDMIDAGVQRWTVPATGTYRIVATGASGGGNGQNPDFPGRGAQIQGDFSLNQGDILQILVGQQGMGTGVWTGGGGGGSFVLQQDDTPLIIAGGGAGASRTYDARTNYTDATGATSGRNGYPGSGGAGGSNGNGGGAGANPGNRSGGGGGLLSNGADGTSGAQGGRSFAAGARGGDCGDCTNASPGGFGGGGGSFHAEGPGGGGGYSGGGAGCNNSGGTATWEAGGGGSYNVGANPSAATGIGTGHGTVSITRL